MSLFGQNPNAWYGHGPNPASPFFATYPPQSDKSASECFTALWMSHLIQTARGNMQKNWPWAEPDDDPEFIAFMAKYGIEIPVRTLEQRLIPMEDA